MMNNSINATTEKISTEMIYETLLRLFFSSRDLIKVNLDISAVSNYIQHIQENIIFVRDCHAEDKTKQIIYANQKQRAKLNYKIEDKIYLKIKNLWLQIKKKNRNVKFYSHYIDSFEISKIESATSNYTLKLSSKFRIHPKIHAQRLKLAHDNDFKLFPDKISSNPSFIDAEDE